MNRARECFSCTLYSAVDKVPSAFLLGRSPFVKEKYTKEFQACTRAGATTKTIQITLFIA